LLLKAVLGVAVQEAVVRLMLYGDHSKSTRRDMKRFLTTLLVLYGFGLSGLLHAQSKDEAVYSLARQHEPALLATLKEICHIETGSREPEGLAALADLIANRLQEQGGRVERVSANTDVYKMEDTPEQIGNMVKASWQGKGTRKILLIAHMDTVYPKGMLAKQPFRIDGNRAYGLGIADDKQGVAAIMHVVTMLRTLKYDGYGTLTVLINGDEEISSPGSRALLMRLGSEHDVVMSFEASRIESDKLALATAGIASVNLTVSGRASHAGSAPHLGVNALYEMAHQILQTRDLSDATTGVKMNWTMARAGVTRNMIPPQATASADVRVLRVEDYDGVEKKLRARIQNKLLSDSKVEMTFERRRPPLESNAASKAFAAYAQRVYAELGRTLVVDAIAEGGGTDAAFAALQSKGAVVERFGLQGFGAHTTDAEYVLIDSIVPRLYLATRLIMDAGRGLDR
jgi:glutamate carboxypeptidase